MDTADGREEKDPALCAVLPHCVAGGCGDGGAGDGAAVRCTITSGMVERMTDDEVRFILGHECGHLAYRHYRANLAFHALGANREDSKMPRLLGVRLSSWNRLAGWRLALLYCRCTTQFARRPESAK